MKIKLPYFSSRGFNMFSAIVAVILIMIGVVMTSTLVSTEEKTSTQIYSMLTNYQLSDAASLARADALQSFNYNFREKMEDYLTFSDERLRNEQGLPLFNVEAGKTNYTFEESKKTFEKMILLKDPTATGSGGQNFKAVVQYVSDRTVDQFKEGTYGRFSVQLSSGKSFGKESGKEALNEGILSVINQDFLEVVDCSDASCPNGSFYFNIPLDKLSDEKYEALPRIVVKDLITGDEIKMAILPRQNLRIYIPIRFFRVLYEARKTAIAMSIAEVGIENMRLGFCDSCNPRVDPLQAMMGKWDKRCPVSEAGDLVQLAQAYAGVTNYHPGGNKPGFEGLKAAAADALCRQAAPAFILSNPSDGFDFFDTQLVSGDYRGVNISGCKLHDVTAVVDGEARYSISGLDAGTSAKLRCGKVTGLYTNIVFKDTNPLYIVKGTFERGKSDVYKIKIQDYTYSEVVPDSMITNLGVCNSAISSCG